MPTKKPKSRSPGEDLFIVKYFRRHADATLDEAKSEWLSQSSRKQAEYERQAQANHRTYQQSSRTSEEDS